MAFYASVFIGIIAACRFFARFKKNVIWILGGILGLYLGRLLSLITASKIRSIWKDNHNVYIMVITNNVIICTIGMFIGIKIGSKFKSHIARVGTAILGAYFLIRGTSRYLPDYPFPESFKVESAGDFDANHFKDTDNDYFYFVWGYIGTFVLLFILGTCFQYKVFPPKRRHDDEEESDDNYASMKDDKMDSMK